MKRLAVTCVAYGALVLVFLFLIDTWAAVALALVVIGLSLRH